jgi:hypothetical protein
MFLPEQPRHITPNIPSLRDIRPEPEAPHKLIPQVRHVEEGELVVSRRRGGEAEADETRADEVDRESPGGVVGAQVVEEGDKFEDGTYVRAR